MRKAAGSSGTVSGTAASSTVAAGSAAPDGAVVEGAERCCQCDGLFSRQWVRQCEAAMRVCWRCEESVRAEGRCPFDTRLREAAGGGVGTARGGRRGGRLALHHGTTFCTHQAKCVVCDFGYAPCAECRMAQGDGETVTAVCAEWRGSGPAAVGITLFFDFDRSLCSTKSGGSPLQGSHTVDADLADLASLYPMHVVTRNSHRREIESFLRERRIQSLLHFLAPAFPRNPHLRVE